MKCEALAGQRGWECVGRAQGQLSRHLDENRRCLQKKSQGQRQRVGWRAPTGWLGVSAQVGEFGLPSAGNGKLLKVL